MTLRNPSCATRNRHSAASALVPAKSPSVRERDRHDLPALDVGAVGGQGRHQPGVLDRAGMQVVREVPDVFREPDRALLERRHIDVQIVGARQRGQPALEAAERDRQARELLAQVVVQVARDPRPLDFLSRDQTVRPDAASR